MGIKTQFGLIKISHNKKSPVSKTPGLFINFNIF